MALEFIGYLLYEEIGMIVKLLISAILIYIIKKIKEHNKLSKLIIISAFILSISFIFPTREEGGLAKEHFYLNIYGIPIIYKYDFWDKGIYM